MAFGPVIDAIFPGEAGGGVSDHGALTGLGDDDHTQYAKADGTRWTDTQTASRAVVSDASGNLVVSAITATELGYLDGVTSNVQDQFDALGALADVGPEALITGGTQEIDGDQIDIDWNPSNYTPATDPAQVTNVDHLTAHLYGIDQALASAGGGATVAAAFGTAIIRADGQNTGTANTNTIQLGYDGEASDVGAVNLGQEGEASGGYAVNLGLRGIANRYGEVSRASNRTSTDGDAQASGFTARIETTDATETEMFLSGSDASSFRVTVPTNHTIGFTAYITARRTDSAGQAGRWKIEGLIANNGGTTTFVDTPVVSSLVDGHSSAWSVTAEADDTNEALVLKVTGEAAKTIQWVADIQIEQVG